MLLSTISHKWQITAQNAIRLQKELAKRVKIKAPTQAIHYLAGLDVAFSPDGKSCIAAVVLWDIVKKRVIEQHVALGPVHFPYIPGLLSFREGPALLKALKRLRKAPDALLCDGQGLAHPRRLGIACHLGVLTKLPALGCAKSRLIGVYEEPGCQIGDKSLLMDKKETIGYVLRTKNNVKPVFVSPGHQIDFAASVDVILRCLKGYRLPEPTRLADRLVAVTKKQLFNPQTMPYAFPLLRRKVRKD